MTRATQLQHAIESINMNDNSVNMSVNIFLFVPNLIGYARVILAIASLFYMSNSPYTAMILYWLSAFLDAFDGMAARALNQGNALQLK